MRTFDNFPNDNICPICKSNDNKECWLMPIDGTEDGNNCEATPVHVECTGTFMVDRMRYNKSHGIIYAFVE